MISRYTGLLQMFHSFSKRVFSKVLHLQQWLINQNNRNLTTFSPHLLQLIFYVFPLGDTTYVQSVIHFVPDFLDHHLVNGHYCIVDAVPVSDCWFCQFCIPTRRSTPSFGAWYSWIPDPWTSGSLVLACCCWWLGSFLIGPWGYLPYATWILPLWLP